jgi:hypothetical protein
MKLLLTKLLLP